MLSTLLRRALLERRPTRHAALIGGPADGLVLTVPRPAPPWVFAALRPMVDGRTLLATASDEMAIYVAALADAGTPSGIARYQRVGTRYLHVSEVSSAGPA